MALSLSVGNPVLFSVQVGQARTRRDGHHGPHLPARVRSRRLQAARARRRSRSGLCPRTAGAPLVVNIRGQGALVGVQCARPRKGPGTCIESAWFIAKVASNSLHIPRPGNNRPPFPASAAGQYRSRCLRTRQAMMPSMHTAALSFRPLFPPISFSAVRIVHLRLCPLLTSAAYVRLGALSRRGCGSSQRS
jgi:hypothetical protein